MNFLKNIFLSDTESEENNENPLEENNKTTYSFLYTRKQWIRKKKIEHEIAGNIDTNISQVGKNTFKWQVHFKNIECKEKTNSIPEFYIFWNYLQRVDFLTDGKGRITYAIQSFGQDRIYKGKKDEIKQFDMDNNRKQTIIQGLKEIKRNPAYQKTLFESNPVIVMLCRNLDMYIKNTAESNSTPVHTYYSEEIMHNYFGKDFHLPVKKYYSWDKRNADNFIAACVGGIDKNSLDEDKFFKYMRKLAGKVNIGRKLFLDYSEYYQHDKKDLSVTGNLKEAENYAETAVVDAWYLEERTFLNSLTK